MSQSNSVHYVEPVLGGGTVLYFYTVICTFSRGFIFYFGEHSNNFLSGDCTFFFLFDFSTLIFLIFGRVEVETQLIHSVNALDLALSCSCSLTHSYCCCHAVRLSLYVPTIPGPVQLNCPHLLSLPALPFPLVASTILALANLILYNILQLQLQFITF